MNYTFNNKWLYEVIVYNVFYKKLLYYKVEDNVKEEKWIKFFLVDQPSLKN